MFGGTNFVEGLAGRTPNRDGLIGCSRKMLDLFDDTVRLGHMPEWFAYERQDMAQRMQQAAV